MKQKGTHGNSIMAQSRHILCGVWIAMTKDDQIENGPKPAKNYEEMLQRINNYNRSIGAEEVQTLEVQYRKKNGL